MPDRTKIFFSNTAKWKYYNTVVFDDDAMDVVGKVFYAPIYMVMFLKKDSLPANMIYDIGKPLEL